MSKEVSKIHLHQCLNDVRKEKIHHIQLSLKVNGKSKHYHKVQKEVNSSEGAKTRVQEVMSRLSVKPARAY